MLKLWNPLSIGLRKYTYSLYVLLKRDLQGEYKKSILGMTWIIIHPLMLLGLYTLVFSGILEIEFRRGAGVSNFAMFLFAGILPYIALSTSVQRACASIQINRDLLDRTRFPAEVIPIVPVFRSAIPEIFGLTLLCLVSVGYAGNGLYWFWLLPVITLARMMLSMGLAWIFSVLNIYLKDIGQALQFAFTFLLFLTPIFYPTEKYPGQIDWLLTMNPLYNIVEAYRKIAIENVLPLAEILISLVFGTVVAAMGLFFYRATIDEAKDFL